MGEAPTFEQHDRENPEAAEQRAQWRREAIAEQQRRYRERPEDNAYGMHFRRQALAAGLPVVPLGALKRLYRDPRLVLQRGGGGYRTVPLTVLKANAARRAATAANAPRRVNGPSGRPRAQANRSSARSGDSPAGDGSEPEPPPPRLTVAASRGTYTHAASRCPACGSVLLWTSGGLVCANQRCPGWAA